MKSAGIIEIYTLERQGCTAADWSTVYLDDNCDLSRIRDCRFSGRVEIGAIAELRSAAIGDCRMNSGVSIVNVRGHLRGLRIGRGVVIADVGTIESEPEASYGIGTEVAVLDETGSRPVHLYPGLSAQLATLMAMHPRWAEEHLLPRLQEKYASRPFPYDLSDGCRVVGCQLLQNVHVGKEVSIEGAKRLVNGAVINNAAPGKGLAGVGADVDAENFLIEDGYAGGGALLRNVYVGQGASLDKGFTAHDSLFFANSAMENGEACAVLAGPYSVSMHKSTLLIGMRTAFFNAGSATNFSNHMYKLGPVHWGTMLRGAKTASGAYVMWGAQIGAFSLVMGPHKYHPDTSMFPFAYLFGDAHGHTLAAPGLMLRSCGLGRDEKKWPIRDRRLRRRLPLHDHVCYDVLNPVTVQAMLRALPLLRDLAHAEPDSHGLVHHGAVAMKPTAALRAHRMYSLAITSYLYSRTHTDGYHLADPNLAPDDWSDLCGQIIPTADIDSILTLDPDLNDPETLPSTLLEKAFAAYPLLELCWVKKLVESEWHDQMRLAPQAVVELEAMIEQDRTLYKQALADHH